MRCSTPPRRHPWACAGGQRARSLTAATRRRGLSAGAVGRRFAPTRRMRIVGLGALALLMSTACTEPEPAEQAQSVIVASAPVPATARVRQTFKVANPARVTALAADVIYDRPVIVYL